MIWRGATEGCGPHRVCPHLDHDLAEGYVVDDELVCAGHGWAFDGDGLMFKRNEFGRVDAKGSVPVLVVREHEASSRSSSRAVTAYPPDEHLLRDLRFSFDHDADGRASRAWMPVVAELCTDRGHARAGAIATLVDVIGGGLAASTAQPDWIATADLTLHLVGGAPPGSVVEARLGTARGGRPS